ncbi:HEPN domain-containing protein [Sphingobacteriales bacterium CHB3]|nr:HEPN domain-containing protein [Sphingobacteriales bacterium CHB3]
MNKTEHITFWIEQAEHDWGIAESLFASRKFDASLFFGHLALEKLLKAAWVRDNVQDVPPKTHNLVLLLEQTRVPANADALKLLRKVNEFNIEARYPDYKLSFYKLCTQEFASTYLDKIKATYTWLTSELKR